MGNKSRDTAPKDKGQLDVRLSTPWAGVNNIASCDYPGGSDETNQIFIQERTRAHETYIREQEKTKRIALIISAVMFILASIVIMFAPEGRESLSYWIGAALLVFSAGAAGYKRLWAKGPFVELKAGEDGSSNSSPRPDSPSS